MQQVKFSLDNGLLPIQYQAANHDQLQWIEYASLGFN